MLVVRRTPQLVPVGLVVPVYVISSTAANFTPFLSHFLGMFSHFEQIVVISRAAANFILFLSHFLGMFIHFQWFALISRARQLHCYSSSFNKF